MRVLVLTNLYPNPQEPNRATFNRHQISALAREHVVRVISPILWTDELSARLRRGARLPSTRRVTCDGITVDHPRYYYTPKLLRSRYGHFFERSVRASFHQAIREFSPEIVFTPWAYPDGWAAMKLGHQAGLPVIIKVHGCDLLWGLQRHAARQERTMEAIRGADGILAVSQNLAARAIEMGADPDRVRVIYDGVDTTLFRPGSARGARARLGLTSDEPIVLFVGSLVPVKSVGTLIEACLLLKRRGLRFRCLLIGDGPLRVRLGRQVARDGLEDCVEFVGARPHDQLGDWYRAANVFVLPSLSEGVPCVLLEAIACGIPFVASGVGGIPEIAHLGKGRLVPPGDVTELADALGASVNQAPSVGPPIRSHTEVAGEIASFLEEIVSRERGVAVASH
jgi:glycosyltransferase involved in cell wall biosynthesis